MYTVLNVSIKFYKVETIQTSICPDEVDADKYSGVANHCSMISSSNVQLGLDPGSAIFLYKNTPILFNIVPYVIVAATELIV